MRPNGFSPFRSLLAAMAILLFGLPTSPQAFAKDRDQGARQFLQAIYAQYAGTNVNGVRWRGPKSSQYFSQALTKLIAKDIKESGGDVGRIGVDPFVDAQDFDITTLKIEIVSENAEEAKAIVSFINMSEPTQVTFDLTNTSQGWRIANMAWAGESRDLLSILSSPMP